MSSPAQSANEAQAPPAWRNAALASAFAVAAIAISVVVLRDASAGAGALFAASFAMFAAASTRFEVEMKFVAFGGDVVPLVAAIVLAPRYAPLVALSCAVAEYPSWRSRVGNTATFVVAAGAAVLVIGAVGAESMLTAGDVATNTVFAIGSFLLVNVGLSLLMVLVAQVVSLPDLVRMLAGSLLATMTFASPLVFAVVYATIHLGLGALPLVLAPIAMCQYFLSLYTRKVQLTEELAEKAQILARTNLQFAAAMVRALDTRDAYTAGHSAAVAVYTRDIAREMGFDDETVRLAHLAGLLHDIGKIGVPGRVLNKTAPLDDEEYELMKTHAAMGADILGEVDLYKDIAVMVRYHHERMDGRGYPDQLEGEAIPAISRMISVADTYSAMTTDRPYREGMPTEKAMSILRECRGTQLDSDFTDAFLRILIVADAAYQRGKQTDFEVEVAKHQALSEVEAEAVRLGTPTPAGPKSPQVPVAPPVPVIPAAVDGELVEVELEREAA